MAISADNRVTLVVSRRPRHDWQSERVSIVESPSLIAGTLETHDVERIILDRPASPDDFLHLLSTLPHEHAGDVMLLRYDGSAFLSACSRGGGRVLYALAPRDIAFYIETNGLLASHHELALTA